MHAIRQYEFGPAQNLRYEEQPDPVPGDGQVRVAVEAAGVHLLDTMIRRGVTAGPYPLPELPMTPGREVAGVVDAYGPGGGEWWVGRRVVAHLGPTSGGYAQRALARVEALHEVPHRMSAEMAVAMIGTGRTAVGILEVAALAPADVVLVTAAAGGLGSLLIQAIGAIGATAIGLAGGPEKVARVADLGAAFAIDYRRGDWPERVRAVARPSVLVDGVGGELGTAAADLLADGGRIVQIGWSSGEPANLDGLARAITVAGPIGPAITQRPGGMRELEATALRDAATGVWTSPLTRFALRDAAGAHIALETRATVGKTVLVP